MQKNLIEMLDDLIGRVEQEQDLVHILPVLEEVRRAAEKGPGFDRDDIARIAEFIMGMDRDDSSESAIEQARRYASTVGLNMFARALLAEFIRQDSEK